MKILSEGGCGNSEPTFRWRRRSSAARRDRLLQGGLLRPGKGDAADSFATPPLDLGISVLEALQEDREDRL
ncbi:MAG: hypothetical protein K0U98_17970 [Deltaproteobacteria bacterium]|nr:hypothetical protein [Deltaproteobacteria bacterium]